MGIFQPAKQYLCFFMNVLVAVMQYPLAARRRCFGPEPEQSGRAPGVDLFGVFSFDTLDRLNWLRRRVSCRLEGQITSEKTAQRNLSSFLSVLFVSRCVLSTRRSFDPSSSSPPLSLQLSSKDLQSGLCGPLLDPQKTPQNLGLSSSRSCVSVQVCSLVKLSPLFLTSDSVFLHMFL